MKFENVDIDEMKFENVEINEMKSDIREMLKVFKECEEELKEAIDEVCYLKKIAENDAVWKRLNTIQERLFFLQTEIWFRISVEKYGVGC